MYSTLEQIKAAAEAVAREQRLCLTVMGVTSGEAHSGYAELVVVRRDAVAGDRLAIVGVDRTLAEPALRVQLVSKLRG